MVDCREASKKKPLSKDSLAELFEEQITMAITAARYAFLVQMR